MGDRKGWITDELGFMLNKPPCEPLPSDAVDEILASYAKTVLRVRGGFKDVQEAKAKLDAHYAGLYEPLIKELVEEAKPNRENKSYTNPIYNAAVYEFEQNLLKALEEL